MVSRDAIGTAVPPPPQEGQAIFPEPPQMEHPLSPSDHLLHTQVTLPVPSQVEHSGFGPSSLICIVYGKIIILILKLLH